MIVPSIKKSIGLGLAPSSVRITKGILSLLIDYAVREKYLTENFLKNVKLPKSRPPKAGCLTVEEAEAFFSVRSQYYYGDAHAFSLFTGMRPEEIFALIWPDVDFKNHTIRIERACKWPNGKFLAFGPTKGKLSDRTIDITLEQSNYLQGLKLKQERAILHRLRTGLSYGEPELEVWIHKERPMDSSYENANLIFSTEDGQVPHMTGPRRAFKAMLERAGFRGSRLQLKWYDLRHTHASHLLMAGKSLASVAERMGHTIAELIRTYAHSIPKEQKELATAFASLINIKW